MEIALAVLMGFLYASGVYMILRRSLVKLIIGLALLGHATNLLIFSIGDLVRGEPPLIAEGATSPSIPFSSANTLFCDFKCKYSVRLLIEL